MPEAYALMRAFAPYMPVAPRFAVRREVPSISRLLRSATGLHRLRQRRAWGQRSACALLVSAPHITARVSVTCC